ncbi:MAG: hypothetical protein HOP02_11745 [Methylococcaceae bacterium]|nr:hypothetical protein [Methylococcaceae bacterium]
MNIAQHISWIFTLTCVLMASAISSQAFAVSAIRGGFTGNTLAANDDGSTGQVPFGFNLNFFGQQYSQGYVNNNGNVTFDSPLGTYTPFGITNNQTKIIAPFFADVDTRVAGSNPVTYGQGLIGSRPAFGVNWIDVSCFSTANGGRNTFQLILVDRSDVGAGDFDIEFNYGSIVWETGTASGGNGVCQGGSSVHVGYSNGTSNALELAGSGINGAFLDSNTITGLIYNSRNSLQDGRYVFEVRNGVAPLGQSISGTVYGNDNSNPLASALVQICTTTGDIVCNLTSTNPNGQYIIGGLSDNTYQVKTFPPAGTNYNTGAIPVVLAGATLLNQDIILLGPKPLPSGTTISPTLGANNGGAVTIPVVYWNNPLTLTTQGCQGGTASYTVTSDVTGSVIASGSMTESQSNSGSYTANIPPFYPNHDNVTVDIAINCPGGSVTHVVFTLYIDPSGVVKDTSGNPVNGASVTLYRSDSSAGPFVTVPNGDAVMSPINRNNPSITNAQGLFGWDVVTGYYKVRAEKAGCTAPGNVQQAFVESAVLTIPPPVTDLNLVLACQVGFAVCDVNQDGVVTNADISNIMGRLRSTVPVGTLGDVNGDGRITTQDARSCALQLAPPALSAQPQ